LIGLFSVNITGGLFLLIKDLYDARPIYEIDSFITKGIEVRDILLKVYRHTLSPNMSSLLVRFSLLVALLLLGCVLSTKELRKPGANVLITDAKTDKDFHSESFINVTSYTKCGTNVQCKRFVHSFV